MKFERAIPLSYLKIITMATVGLCDMEIKLVVSNPDESKFQEFHSIISILAL